MRRLRRISGCLALAMGLVGCQSRSETTGAGSAWIAWDPADLGLVKRVEQEVASWEQIPDEGGGPITASEMIEFDPLSVVPDERFRAAFRQLKATDARIRHCQMGPTGSNIATVEFTAEPVSETAVLQKVLQCELHPERRASLCRFNFETAYRLPGSDQVFRISDDVDRSPAIRIMSLLARGAVRNEVSDFPPSEWPKDWPSQHEGRYLGAAVMGDYDGPHRYELWFPGCGCQQILVLEYGSERAQSDVIIVGQHVICV